MQNPPAMKEPTAPLRSSARIQERIAKAVELAETRAGENLLNPPKPTIGKKIRKRKNRGRHLSIDGVPPPKNQKIIPGSQGRDQRTKVVKGPEVGTEDSIQEGTVNQGLLGNGMPAFNMQEDAPTISQLDTMHLYNRQEPYGHLCNQQEPYGDLCNQQEPYGHLYNQQELYGQQQGDDFQNWGSSVPIAEPNQSWMQSGWFYQDPDGYYWSN